VHVPAAPLSGKLSSFSSFCRRFRLQFVLTALLAGPTAPVGGAEGTDIAALKAQAEGGNPEALNALGNAYANGEGVAQDFAASMRCYRAAAAKGYAPAEFNLGMMYELGRGLPPNPQEAFKDYLEAAQLGYGPAQFNVGNMYATGSGVKIDLLEAAVWFRQAAERGIAAAQYNLALAYERGRGVGKDEATAQKWYRAAATQGYARARYNLALMLEDGRGSAVDLAAAADLYHVAALQGLGLAQNNYGILLAEGKGGLRADPAGAYAWLCLAAENGVRPDTRDQLAKKLTAAQVVAGNRQLAILRAQLGSSGTGPAIGMPSVPALPAATVPSARVGAAGDLAARLAAAEDELARLKSSGDKTRTDSGEQLASALARVHQLELNNKELDDEARNSIIQLSSLNLALQKAQDELTQLKQPGSGTAGPGSGPTPAGDGGAALSGGAITPAAGRPSSSNAPAAEIALAAANSKVEDLTKQLAQARAGDAERQKLREENEKLAAAAQASAAELTAAQARAEAAEQKLAVSVKQGPAADSGPAPLPAAEAAKLQAALDQARMDLIAARQGTEEIRTQLEVAKDDLTTAQHKASADLAAAKQAQSAAQTASRQAAVPSAATAHQEKVVQGLQEELAAAKKESALAAELAASRAAADQAKIADLQNTNQSLADQNGRMSGQLSELTAHGSASAAAQARIADLQRSLAAAQAAGEAQQSSLQKLHHELDAAKAAAPRPAAPSLRPADAAKLSAALQALGELRERNDSLEKDLQVARASEAAALAAQESAVKSLPDVDATRIELNTLRGQVAKLDTQLKDSIRAGNRAQAEIGSLRGSLAASQAATAAATARAAQLGAANLQLSQDKNAALGRVAGLAAQLDKTRTQLDATDRKLTSAGQTANAAERQHAAAVAGLQLKLAHATQLGDAQAASLLDWQHRFAAQGRALEDTRGLNAKLAADNAKMVQTSTDLGQRNAALDRQVVAVSSALATAQDRVTKLAAAKAELELQLQSMGARLAQTEHDRDAKVALAQDQNVALAARLKEAEDALSRIVASSKAMAESGYAPVPASKRSGAPRTYLVKDGDSLSSISLLYYGTDARWQDIYTANRDQLKGKAELAAGLRINIP
jgi:TPR repeat protein